ncbi:MAG TPA: acyl dehydratase [Methylomirabilota bacterium]|nr:acyl dehydratase [Methylomirabilota bacterium]
MTAAAERYWEDVQEGDELKGFSLELTMTRMVLQVSGSQDFYPIHHDPDFARAAGHENIFINTAFIRGCLCRLVTDWMGRAGFLKALGFQMRRPNWVGETIAVRGRVRKKQSAGRIDLEVWIENARDAAVTVPGSATVILPSRS